MKTNLVKTDSYLLLIDEEAEIKGTPCLCYNSIKNTWSDDVILYQGSMPEYHYKGFQKIVAYHPLTKETKELDLPLLPNPFENDRGLEKSLNKYIKDLHSQEECIGFIEGYKASQSKQFSLEDMVNAAKYGYEFRDTTSFPEHKFEDGCINNFKQHLQSLPTQQLPKEFIPGYVNEPIYTGDGCHKDNWILKTITNSEGKEELVGNYKY